MLKYCNIQSFIRIGKLAHSIRLKGDKHLSYYVRLMSKEDVAQVTEIDREAFPTQLPPPNYQRELQNRLAHYIVVCDKEKTIDTPEVKAPAEENSTGLASKWRRLFNLNRFFNNDQPPPSGHHICGFVGFWVMADEAHITSIAVREVERRRGLGELLLISAIDLATKLKADIMTLEVRASNSDAQSLYSKYSFIETGVRTGYYTDNREDALVMSTRDISSVAFQTSLQQLKQVHSRKWGVALYQIAR